MKIGSARIHSNNLDEELHSDFLRLDDEVSEGWIDSSIPSQKPLKTEKEKNIMYATQTSRVFFTGY